MATGAIPRILDREIENPEQIGKPLLKNLARSPRATLGLGTGLEDGGKLLTSLLKLRFFELERVDLLLFQLGLLKLLHLIDQL